VKEIKCKYNQGIFLACAGMESSFGVYIKSETGHDFVAIPNEATVTAIAFSDEGILSFADKSNMISVLSIRNIVW
jgi:hypothetical protein